MTQPPLCLAIKQRCCQLHELMAADVTTAATLSPTSRRYRPRRRSTAEPRPSGTGSTCATTDLAAIDAVLPGLATRARLEGAALPGWVPLLEKLAAAVAETLHDEDRFELLQVKEKLGALRLYVFAECSNDARQRRLEDLAEWAEHRSTTLCMFDGTDDGRLVDDRGGCTLGDRALALPIEVLHEELRRFG